MAQPAAIRKSPKHDNIKRRLLRRLLGKERFMQHRNFLVLDGIDGCGKSTILQFFGQEFENRGKTSFNVAEHIKTTRTFPRYEDLPPADVLLSAEPTHVWTGAAIRGEIISNKAEYSAMETAQLFAIDRHMLYNRIILPALSAGKIVLQDRSFLTTLVYQPVQGGITEKEILALPGNVLADANCPQAFIQVECPVDIALERLHKRSGKKDDSIFERAETLEKLRNAFMSSWFLEYLNHKGIKRMVLPNNEELDRTRLAVAKLIQKFFPNL